MYYLFFGVLITFDFDLITSINIGVWEFMFMFHILSAIQP